MHLKVKAASFKNVFASLFEDATFTVEVKAAFFKNVFRDTLQVQRKCI